MKKEVGNHTSQNKSIMIVMVILTYPTHVLDYAMVQQLVFRLI